MGAIAVDLGNSAKDVVLSQRPGAGGQISRDDDAMDQLHRHLFTVLMDTHWKHGVAAAVDITLLGRFYERFADHAVEIGRRVVFQATGGARPDLQREPEDPAVLCRRGFCSRSLIARLWAAWGVVVRRYGGGRCCST